ncbi:MAG: long-chain fatty acid--CoA ligase, partial [Sandaracinaceae bacterium]|nr:long-chain fatty acid--CoA ligase [Sandaracinaceae bacterium]
KLENGKYVMPAPVEEHLKLSPYIANVMLHGANRPYNVAVVVPEKKMLEEWAANEEIDLAAAGAKARLQSLLQNEIETRGAELRRYELPKRLVIADEDFTTDNGLLTPTLKLKRRAVLDRYGADLEALYRGGDAVEAAIESEEQALLAKR